MFFEDEKDFIEDPAEIHIDEDGTVSWEAVLNDSDDDLMAARKEAPAAAPKRSNINADIVMGDELELVSNDDDDDDNEQLAEILGQSSPAAVAGGVADASAKAKPTFEEDYDAFGETEGLSSEEEFDIDKQLSNVVLEQNTSEEIIQPRKDERAKKASGGGNNGTVVLLLFVLVLCIAGGVYWYMTQYGNVNNLNANSLAAPKTVAQKMNDVQKEDIDQRSEEFQQQEAFEQENLQQEAIPAEQLAQENIPVVNEEQAGDVKAQEEQKLEDEKKKVIDVKGAEGRVNPFMPSSKYASSEIPVADIDFDSSGIPKPPEAYGIKEDTMNLVSISVSGIMYDEVKPSAIITYQQNDYFVQKGDRLDDFKVEEIARNHVAISQGANVYRASIGEAFQLEALAGSARYVPANQGGGRHYYSPKYDITLEKKIKGRRYVSEDEIQIKAKEY